MKDSNCTDFLQWALPRLHLHWPGFRKIRAQVCKRVSKRLGELGLADAAAYRAYLESRPAEWDALDALCQVTISRFYRDREVFRTLERDVLPHLARAAVARRQTTLRFWSAGCASGEEPYTLAILWNLRLKAQFPELQVQVVATDSNPAVLDRATAGCYRRSSLQELPAELGNQGFEFRDGVYRVRDEHRRLVSFRREDIRAAAPEGLFDLVLCRNLVLTYFDAGLRDTTMRRIASRIRPGGALVIGAHESLPADLPGFEPWPGQAHIFRRVGGPCGGG